MKNEDAEKLFQEPFSDFNITLYLYLLWKSYTRYIKNM